MHARVCDHAGSAGARADAPARMAFRYSNNVGTRNCRPFAAQWLACTFPYRRFAGPLTRTDARLGASVGRYAFTVEDFHPLLLAGLPAHYCWRIGWSVWTSEGVLDAAREGCISGGPHVPSPDPVC